MFIPSIQPQQTNQQENGTAPRSNSFANLPKLLRASFTIDDPPLIRETAGVLGIDEPETVPKVMKQNDISPWAAVMAVGGAHNSIKYPPAASSEQGDENDVWADGPDMEAGNISIRKKDSHVLESIRSQTVYRTPLHNAEEENIKRNFIIKLSKCFFAYGAPTHQLEPHLTEVSKALNIDAHFLLMPGIVLISFGSASHNSKVHFIKQVGGMHMSKLAQVNALCLTVTKQLVDIYNAVELLDAICDARDYPWWLSLLTFPITSFCFALLMFQTTWLEAVVSGILGFIAGVIYVMFGSSVFILLPEFLAGLTAAFAAKAVQGSFYNNGISFDPLKVVLSSLIMFLPGMSLTIAVIELSTRNLVSGTVRMFGALFTALFLGFGMMVGESLVLWHDSSLKVAPPANTPTTQLWSILFFVPMAMSINLLFQASKHQWPIMCFASFTGYVVVNLANLVPALAKQPIAINVIVSAAIGIVSNVCEYIFNDSLD
ncbi:UNVERIFIED_CONTAM: hypothetical protein HDU68_000870 [Siphonaria sp. JEL0065]|nr:hypothetical protein HDU68_000870 [Siphonaria sp. JEL0065]